MQLKVIKEEQSVKNCQEGEPIGKRYKKHAYDDSNSAKKQMKSKIDIQGQKNKITKYFVRSTYHQSKQIQQSQPVKKQIGNKLQQLQEKIKEKDKLINQLKIRKQDEEQRISHIIYESRQFKKKNKHIVASSILELAQIKRSQLYRKDEQVQNFINDKKSDGNVITQLAKQISLNQQIHKKLDQTLALKTITTQQKTRTIFSRDCIFRELRQLRKELQQKQKEIAIYKDRMRLVQKQKRSTYYQQKWPLVYQRYQTLFLLGSGGFGQVYKCYDIETNRYVALKIIDLKNKDISYEETNAIFKHLRRQVQIQRQVNHPNIVKFNNLVQLDQGSSKVVFQIQYCSGIQLSVYLRKCQCIQQKQAKLIIRQLFSAINYLYSLKEKVIHFDLKPSNIMLCGGLVKIFDFGLSKVMTENQQSNIELTSQGLGTFWYLPPQAFQRQSPKVSCKVDVWSLGIIFFEILYGKKPFGQGISQSQIFQKGIILKAFKPEFPKQNPKKYKISQDAIDFITLCLKYNPSDRLSPLQAYQHPYLLNNQ